MNRSLTIPIPFSVLIPFGGPGVGWVSEAMEWGGWLVGMELDKVEQLRKHLASGYQSSL